MVAEIPLELRLAGRAIARRPWQPIIVALTLAVAIGAVGLTFAAVYAVAFRPLVYRDPERILVVRDATDLLSANLVESLHAATSIESVAAYREIQPTIRDGEHTRRISAAEVEPDFFGALGVRPMRGRRFAADDYVQANGATVIVSHALAERWRTTGSILGASLVLDGEARTVVGIMPSGFGFPSGADVWMPLVRPSTRRDDARFEAIARLRSGASYAAAVAELATIGRRRARDANAPNTPQPLRVDRLTSRVRSEAMPAFWLTVAIVALVFVLTLTTIASLFVARAAGRSRDVVIHRALGATLWQLLRQAVAETGIVCAIGALCGGAIVIGGARLLPVIAVGRAWLPSEVIVDWRVVLCIVMIAISVAFALGLVAVVAVNDLDAHTVLRTGAAATSSRGQRRLQRTLLAVEVAMVTFLVLVAATLERSYVASERAQWGYDSRHIVFGTVALPQTRFENAHERLEMAARVGASVRAARIAGRATVFAESFPAWNDGGKATVIAMTGVRNGRVASMNATLDVDTAYFATMGVRIIAGRGIAASDVAGSTPVIVIDQRLARRNWPDGNAIGQQIRFVEQEPNGPWYTIVGVASNATEISFVASMVGEDRLSRMSVGYRALAQVDPTWPGMGERFAPGFAFAVHVSGDVDRQIAAVRAAVAKAAPDEPLEHVGTLQAYFNGAGRDFGSRAAVFALVGALGIALCALGVIGLVADQVARRTRELGVRVALGAQRYSIVGLVLEESVGVTVVGVGSGLVLSIAAIRLYGHLIFGVGGGLDDRAVVVGGVTAVLALVIAAAAAPALRAASVNPAIALRAE